MMLVALVDAEEYNIDSADDMGFVVDIHIDSMLKNH
jgi:hypothetical protein